MKFMKDNRESKKKKKSKEEKKRYPTEYRERKNKK